jgi:hypothetical protein
MAGKRNRLGILAILAVVVAAVFVFAGCVGPRQSQSTSGNNHYGAKGIAFDYPKSWVPSSSSSRYALTTITDPNAERTSIFFERRVMPAGSTLESEDNEVVSEWSPTDILSEENLTVAGLPAIKTELLSMQGIPVREYKTGLVLFEKDGQLYSIALSTPSEVYDAALPAFDMVLTTFTITQ